MLCMLAWTDSRAGMSVVTIITAMYLVQRATKRTFLPASAARLD
jgi:hypothetical protein